MLGITTDENWKEFAKHLGFTKHEIRNRLSSTTDPFALIMGAFQARGGTLYGCIMAQLNLALFCLTK